MELQNHDRFNDVVDRVFVALSAEFPLPIDIDAFSLGLAEGPAYKTVDFDEVETEYLDEHIFVARCIQWLNSAGYLSANKLHYSFTTGVVFTEKGLQLVDAAPSSLHRSSY